MKIPAFFNSINSIFSTKEASGVQPQKKGGETPAVQGDSVTITAGSTASPVSGKSSVQQTSAVSGTSDGTIDEASTKPRREDFSSDEDYDKAYFRYQTLNMKALAQKFPTAMAGTSVYYGCEWPPDVVLKKGIPEKGGDDFDLKRHQLELDKEGGHNPHNSAFRGSSPTAVVAAAFADTGGYVYVLDPLGGGIDIDNAIMMGNTYNPVTMRYDKNMLTGEQEICIGSRQPACNIKGYFKVGIYSDSKEAYRLSEFVPNPDYKPMTSKDVLG